MRVLWLSPWMRTLAREYAEGLRSLGHDVLLVTSDQHPQPLESVEWELVLDPRPKDRRTWASHRSALRAVRDFAADVVVTELVRDPRWIAFAGRTPRIDIVHDDRPHDASESRPAWERVVFGRWSQRSTLTVCFSDHVARSLQSDRSPAVVPLASDIADSFFGEPLPAAERRDFIMLGRLNDYKNIEVVFRAWEMHCGSDSYRGDVLRLFGASSRKPDLPDNASWNGGGYEHDAVIPVLRKAKGSIAHYRVATQSGVQVLSMQAGVMPIVSAEGALPEFQPPRGPVVDKDDVAGLAAAFNSLADPRSAAEAGALANRHYRSHFSLSVAAAQLECALMRASGHIGTEQRI